MSPEAPSGKTWFTLLKGVCRTGGWGTSSWACGSQFTTLQVHSAEEAVSRELGVFLSALGDSVRDMGEMSSGLGLSSAPHLWVTIFYWVPAQPALSDPPSKSR